MNVYYELYSSGKTALAISTLKKELEKRKSNNDAKMVLLLARCLLKEYMTKVDYPLLEEAAAAYTKALQYKENAANVDAMYELANVLIRMNNFPPALEILKKIVSEYPNHPILMRAVYSSAVVLKHMGTYNQSGAYFQYVLEDPPKPYLEMDIQFAIARLYDQDNQKDLSQEAWTRWLRLRKTHLQKTKKQLELTSPTALNWKMVYKEATYWVEMGDKYDANFDLILAVDAFSIALEINSDDSTSWFKVAKIYKKMNLIPHSLAAASHAIQTGCRDMSLRSFLKEELKDAEWIAKFEKEDKAAKRIQNVYRGYKSRKLVKHMRKEYTKASLKVQSLARGALGRKKANEKRKARFELLARKYLNVIMNKQLITVFRIWQKNVHFLLERKRLRKSAHARLLDFMFQNWEDGNMMSEAEKNAAATKIQALVRGHIARLDVKWLRKCNYAATYIQKIWRGYSCRKVYSKTFIARKIKAVITIQRFFRGFLGRRYAREELLQTKHVGFIRNKEANYEKIDLVQAKYRAKDGLLAHLPKSVQLSPSDVDLFFRSKSVVADVNDLNCHDVQIIGEKLKNNTTVETLMLYNGEIGIRGLKHLVAGLKVNTSLRTFTLGTIRIGSSGALLISSVLPSTYLINLYLEGNFLNDKGVKSIARVLKDIVTLRKILLSNNGITSIGAAYIGKALRDCPNLHVLGLSGNLIGDDGVQALANGLSNTECRLMSLWLRNNKEISDLGVSALVDALLVNKYLVEIDLSGNAITDYGAKQLAKGVSHSKINRLYLNYNKISNIGSKELKSAKRERSNSIPEIHMMEGNNIDEDVFENNNDYYSLFKNSTIEKESIGKLAKITSPKRVKISSSVKYEM